MLSHLCLYFSKYENDIREIFTPNYNILNNVQTIYNNIVRLYNNKFLISVHIRKGDYIYYKDQHPILSKNYYLDAINMFDKRFTYVFFSDEIDWCEKEFQSLDVNKY